MLSIRTLYNYSLELDINLFNTIKDIKTYIFETIGIPIRKQVIILDGNELKNNQTLEQCGVTDGMTISLAYPAHYDNNL